MMNKGDKYIIVFYDARNGDPADVENSITSPRLIRQMCKELMEAHDVYDDKSTIINMCVRQAKAEGMVLSESFPPAFGRVAWGDWVEVARHKKNPDMRLYLVKVVDAEITEIDRKWQMGKGGGW
jgi:hypothetical protein